MVNPNRTDIVYREPRIIASTGIAIGSEIAALFSVPLIWHSYWYLFLTGGLVLLGLLIAGWGNVGHPGRVAVTVLASIVVFWVLFALFQVEVLDVPAINFGGPVGPYFG